MIITAQPALFEPEPVVSTSYVAIDSVPAREPAPKVLSLFSGAGGLDLGLEKAGFATVACVEADINCRLTLRKNRPDWLLIDGESTEMPGDIRLVKGEAVLEALGLQRGELDLIAGGPPCQSFSNLGLRKGQDDPMNGDLSLHFLRLCDELHPKAVLFENVEGLLHGRHSPIRDEILTGLGNLGYSTISGVLSAADYGDPQLRRRFIILGCRTGADPRLPAPTHFESEASQNRFQRLTGIKGDFHRHRTVGDAFQYLESWNTARADNISMGVSEIVRQRMIRIQQGENFKVLPESMLPDCWKSGKHQGADTFGRLRLDRPSVTIRTSAYNPAKGRYIHPTAHRGLSTLEMAVLQSFPESWEFVCKGKPTLVGIGRMIGNAVPGNLGTAIGKAIMSSLLN